MNIIIINDDLTKIMILGHLDLFWVWVMCVYLMTPNDSQMVHKHQTGANKCNLAYSSHLLCIRKSIHDCGMIVWPYT